MVHMRRGENDAHRALPSQIIEAGHRAALPRRSRHVPSRGSNHRPSGKLRSSIPCGRWHRSHSPPARSNRTRRLSSGQSLGLQGPQFGASWHRRIQHAAAICVQDQQKERPRV